MSEEVILSLKNVSLQKEEKNIISNINIDIWKGHIHSFLGKNGAGKTTLASVIMGRPGYREYTGTVVFKGEDVKELEIDERARKGITMSLQEPARFEGLTVKKYLQISSRNNGYKPKEALKAVNLSPEKYMTRMVDETLSGGERKKVELASMLCMKPDIVLLDEPDSGIDVASLQNIFDALKYFTSYGGTVIMITHSVEVLNHSEHSFLLCDGVLKTKGSIEKVLPVFQEICTDCAFDGVENE